MKDNEIISELRSIIAAYNLDNNQAEAIEEIIDKISSYGHSYDETASVLYNATENWQDSIHCITAEFNRHDIKHGGVK